MCSTCQQSVVNEEKFDDNNLYHFCVCERHKMCTYFKKHLKFLQSNILRKMFVQMCSKKKCTAFDILQGNLGGKQNERTKISFLPTYEMLENILCVCRETNIPKIEEIAAGVGFHKELLNELINTKQCYRVNTVTATDGFYEEGTANKFFCSIIKKDLADYIVTPSFDADTCYLIFDIPNYSLMRTISRNVGKFDDEIYALLKWKKPKMLIVISENINIDELDTYTTFNFYPNIISKYDDNILIDEGETDFKGRIFIKKDVPFDTSIFEKIMNMGCKPVTQNASYIFRCMVNEKLAPEWIIKLPEERLMEYVRSINEIQMQNIPLYLEEGNIDKYIMLAHSFRANMGTKKILPIATKEKFNFLCSYLDMAVSDQGLKYLHENGSVPRSINDAFVAYMYLICNYFS